MDAETGIFVCDGLMDMGNQFLFRMVDGGAMNDGLSIVPYCQTKFGKCIYDFFLPSLPHNHRRDIFVQREAIKELKLHLASCQCRVLDFPVT